MNRIKNTTPFKTNDIILPPNIKTPINYQQHYQQTHNTPITTKPTIDTLYTYKPVTSITSITTSYNQLLHIPNTISYGQSTSTNHINQINNQHVRFDPIIDNLTYVLLALYITLADYLCSLFITCNIKIFISSYGKITSSHQYHQKYNYKTTPYGPPITTTTLDEPHTHTIPIKINLQQNIIHPPNAHITTKSNDKNTSKIINSNSNYKKREYEPNKRRRIQTNNDSNNIGKTNQYNQYDQYNNNNNNNNTYQQNNNNSNNNNINNNNGNNSNINNLGGCGIDLNGISQLINVLSEEHYLFNGGYLIAIKYTFKYTYSNILYTIKYTFNYTYTIKYTFKYTFNNPINHQIHIQIYIHHQLQIQPTIMDNFDTIKPLPSTTLPSLHNKSVDLLNTNTNTNTNNDYNIFNNIKLSQYGDDSINNLQHVLQTNDYSTGMVGKWHLMTPDDNGHNYECYRVDQGADEILYDVCKDILKTQGFDFVDGYYHENIHPNNPDYSHNPEWMVSVSQEFIDVSIEEEKPFFLYFSTTLAHVPNIYIEDVFSNYNYRQTPGGLLYADDIPNDTGMATRDEIWQMTLDTLGISNTNTATIDSSLINMIAATIWIDNAIGAMINYLKKHKLYDNTFIVLANDHGYDAKGTLYEHGSRIFQYIRYPPLFGTAGYIMPDDFIVANYDLAAVIFSLSESHIPSNYILDGTNWLPDVLNEINGVSNSKMQCCNERYIDTYNSHGIVTKNNKYIFRATDEIRSESPPPLNAYPYIHDTEQLYRLNIDPTEQKNKINSGALSDITFQFRAKMINYIEQVACIGDDITLCTKPMIINKDIPGYTCNKEVTYKQTWSGVINNNYNKIAKLNEAEINILSSTQKCNGLNNNFNSQEYVYMFDKIQSEMLRLTVILCCNNGKSFGSKYDIWPGGYTGNDVYNNNNENKYQNDDRIQNVITSIQSSNELYNNKTLGILFIVTIIALLLYYYLYYQKNANQYKELGYNTNQCVNLLTYGSA